MVLEVQHLGIDYFVFIICRILFVRSGAIKNGEWMEAADDRTLDVKHGISDRSLSSSA